MSKRFRVQGLNTLLINCVRVKKRRAFFLNKSSIQSDNFAGLGTEMMKKKNSYDFNNVDFVSV